VADLVRNLARAASIEAMGSEEEGVSDKAKKRASRLNRYAAHVQTTRGIDSLLRELQAVEGVPCSIADFDTHPDLLACRNGVVDLRTGELRPHDAGLMLTRCVDYDYDPRATAPRWTRFFTEVFPDDPALAAYMQRLVGYGITGHTSEECFAIHWGHGANGKSVFTDTLAEVFRDFTTTTPFSTFEVRSSGGIPNDLAALKGARQVMAAEGEQGRPMAEAVLKRVTGRDLIAARFMRKEFFEFRPSFLLHLATNFKPNFKGQDDGLWRRVKLIPWKHTFAPKDRDHQLGAKLLKEAEGILAWAVAGAGEWYAHGLGDPPVIQAATLEYKETSNALAGYLPGVYELDPSGGRISGKILFEAYLNWAEEENLPQREVWTRKAFFSAMEERGLAKRRDGNGIVFDGIRRARNFKNADGDRAETGPVAHSPSTTKEPPTIAGANLGDVI
jgi:putative DNA primase/helicase